MTARAHLLFAAPHRLSFLVGTVNLSALAAWWLLHLAATQLPVSILPSGDIPPSLLHAPAMLFLAFPPFVFGFLMTVFPRWMGYPDLVARQHAPASILLAAGSVFAQTGTWLGEALILVFGLTVFAAGWAYALFQLAQVVLTNRRDRKPPCLHAISALAALACGLIALLLSTAFVASADAALWRAGHVVGVSGFLLPIFLTVSHRMVPFFAGGVVKDYVRWRPDWLIPALWFFLGIRAGAQLLEAATPGAMADAGLALLTALMCWKWWPRAAAPGLLNVLIWGFAWAPAGFGLSALAQAGLLPGLAGLHALLIGFCGTMLIAMVTRVTQGHSGGALEMNRSAWLAFFAIQIAAVLRIAAAIESENGVGLVAAAAIFAFGLLPWLARNAKIYARPRIDGRPG